MEAPFLMENEDIRKYFAPDVIARAKKYLEATNINGTGYY